MKDHMTSRIISVIFCLLTNGLMLPAQAASLLQSVTAITQVFGDGQQVVAVALKYSQPILKSVRWCLLSFSSMILVSLPLPSQRQTAERYHVSIPTQLRRYRLQERKERMSFSSWLTPIIISRHSKSLERVGMVHRSRVPGTSNAECYPNG